MFFVICSTLFMFQLSTCFRMEMELEQSSALFHIETQQRLCGCEERNSLKKLQMRTEWKPEDFMTHHGKLWLGGIKSDQQKMCAQMCLLVNQRTTHFTFEGKPYLHAFFYLLTLIGVKNIPSKINRVLLCN